MLPRPGQSLLRLILSSEGVNQLADVPMVIGAQILDHDPGGLLSVRVEPHGWAYLLTIEAVLRRRLDEHIGTASGTEMEAVGLSLAAMLDLH